MPVSELHQEIAAIALRAGARHGFALAGGNALLAHELVDRETEDVDLFTDKESGVEAAAGAVESALRRAGYVTERQDDPTGLAEVFEGMSEGLAEWLVTAPDGRQTMLQMSYFNREHEPVRMSVGPVLDLEDLIGQKVCALALLTELSTRGCRFLGQQSRSVARFLARDIRGRREGSSVAGCSACREISRHRRSMGALPAARR